LSSFVKHGAASGYIEIELKGPMGRKNLVIRRKLASLSNGSTFTLNGVAASGTEIKHKMAELNVQVGNLWYVLVQQFLSVICDLVHHFISALSFRKTEYQSSLR